jgi:hypothetical protein
MLVAMISVVGCGAAATGDSARACQSLSKQYVATGMSDYEKCMVAQANRSQPADKELCKMAGSEISADGKCLLGQ